jgi:hypothetical protein
VHASREGGADVGDGRLAGRRIERRDLDQDVGLRVIEKLADRFEARAKRNVRR